MTLFSWLILSYACAAGLIFVIGSIIVIARWIFLPKGTSGTYLGYPYLLTFPGNTSRASAFKNMLKRIFLFSSLKDDPYLRTVTMTFHWSLWIVIAAHADLVLMPYFASIGISEQTMEMIGTYLGTSLAVIMVAAGFLLLLRRITDKYVRRISSTADYFSILLIIAIGISGIYMRVALPSLFAYNQVSPYIHSIFTLSPINIPFQWPFIIHFFLVCTLLIYFPCSKFMHPYSFLTNPTMYSIFHPGEANETKD
ncbi:MAG: respiratory nitrate reductase subunit gamma [Candidatus Thermoplasmatota archaeon]|jgi:nitrate reductase gamma subunit|nr:respiratory nitrate reductase subunit gamma [Candidatus Thermoplasmatota archaeon]MCL5789607.1 respiratory nitrate reductase subunit gamma [Candidatus Thermoplasmatota archaeon]